MLKEISYQHQFLPRFSSQDLDQTKTRQPNYDLQANLKIQHIGTQPNPQQEANVRYINEEEYARLIEQQNDRNTKFQRQQTVQLGNMP